MKSTVIKNIELVISDLLATGSKGMTYAEIGKISKQRKANFATNFFMKRMGWLRIAPGQQPNLKKPRVVLIDTINNAEKAAVLLHEHTKKYSQEYQKEKQLNKKTEKAKAQFALANMPELTQGKVKISRTELTEDFAINYLKERGYKILKPVTKFEEVI